MEIIVMAIGLAIFTTGHMLPTVPDTRARLVERFGAVPYRGLVSLLILAGFLLIVWGYANADRLPFYDPPSWGRHVTFLFMLPVFPLLIAAYLPGTLRRRIGHPMILSVKIWAFAHFFVRGDIASFLLFATLLVWAIYDRISLKKREAAGLVTVQTGPFRNDIIAVVGGLAIYVFFVLHGHEWLIGYPLVSS